jgi:hypothetical protein
MKQCKKWHWERMRSGYGETAEWCVCDEWQIIDEGWCGGP